MTTKAKRLDIFWSFRSPYSWIALARLRPLLQKLPVDPHFRFVRPLALREADFFQKARPQFVPYLMLDAKREADRYAVPIALPNPDPIQMDMATGLVAEHQPALMRLLDLGIAAEDMWSSGADLAFQIAGKIWQGEEWQSDQSLQESAEKAGLDWDALKDWTALNADLIRERLENNEKEQAVHHWGVPLFVLEGEPFFGQDRIDTLLWRLGEVSK